MAGQSNMEPAYVNDVQAAKRFFDDYDILYDEVTEGENKEQLLVMPIRPCDREQRREATKRLERSRLRIITDHPNVFRDLNDNAIIIFSPYDINEFSRDHLWLEMSGHSTYGNGTKTFVAHENILQE